MAVKHPISPDPTDSPRFCAIVLAAGAGRRFGGGKLLAPFRGGRLLDGALRAALAAPVERVVVVTGEDEAVAEAARAFAVAQGGTERMDTVRASRAGEGLSASLRAGLAALPRDCDAAFVFLGDMPLVPPDLAARLARAWTGALDAVQPVHDGRPGHPVLLSRALFARAQALEGDRGAQKLLDAPGVRLLRLEVEAAGATLDVDTPDALAALS